jgi:hypothetical protein
MTSENKTTIKKSSFLFKVFKVFGYIVAFFLILIIAILFIIQIKSVQNYGREKLVTFLEKKLDTKVVVKDLSITFPKLIVLEGIYVEDLKKDTLFASDLLKVDIDMFYLLKGEVHIKEVITNGLTARLKRQRSEIDFNYQFIIDAFESDTPSEKEKNPVKIKIDRIIADKTNITFLDVFTGNEAVFYVNHLESEIEIFDPSSLTFDVPTITLEGIRGYVNQTSAIEIVTLIEETDQKSTNSKEEFLKFSNKQTIIRDADITYQNEVSALSTKFYTKELDVFPKNIDLENYLIEINKIEMNNFDGTVTLKSEKDSEIITMTTSEGKVIEDKYLPWKVKVGELRLDNNQLIFDDNTKPYLKQGMDFGHMDIKNLNFHANQFYFFQDTFSAYILSASMQEKSGFILNELNTDFEYTSKSIELKNLNLKTPGSSLRRDIVVRFPSIDEAMNNYNLFELDVDILKSRIQVKDILLFVPILVGQVGFTNKENYLDVETRMLGNLKKLTFRKLKISGFSNTNIDLSGTLSNVLDQENIIMDLNIKQFNTTAKDITSIAPANSLPEQITLPENLQLQGIIKGGLNKMYVDMAMKTSLGNASVLGTLNNASQPLKASYDLSANFDGLQFGKITQQEDSLIGDITAQFTIKGVGYQQGQINATVKGLVNSFQYNKYTYNNVRLDATMDGNNFQADGDIADSNIHLNFEASGNLDTLSPTISFSAVIDSIKTKPLNLTEEAIFYSGKIVAEFPEFDLQALEGKLYLTNSHLITDEQDVEIDSISLVVNYADEVQSITLSSAFLQASLIGKYKIIELGDIFINAIEPYYSINNDSIKAPISPYNFKLIASISEHPTLKALIPSLNRMQTISLDADFADDNTWKATILVPYVSIGTEVINQATLLATADGDQLNITTEIFTITSGESITMVGTKITSEISDDKVDFAVRIGDKENVDKYLFNGIFLLEGEETYSLSIDNENLLLNYEPWTIKQGNSIRISPISIVAQDFILNQDNQSLLITNEEDNVLQIEFQTFRLSTLTGLFQADSLLVDGTLNGLVKVKDIIKQPTFTSDVVIKNLAVNNDTIGDVQAKISNTSPNVFTTDISLSGNDNNITLIGDYTLKPNNNSDMDFVLTIEKLQMKTMENASFGNIKESQGYINGKVNIAGNMKTWDIDGNIGFFKTSLLITKLNSVFKVDEGQLLAIDNTGLRFNTFTIKDEADNQFIINGNAFTKNYLNYNFDLRMRARNFQALNSTRANNQAYFGQIYFDTNLRVTGTEKAPIVDGNIRINEETVLTMVLPQTEPGLVAREGVVVFVDKNSTDPELIYLKSLDSLNNSSIVGMDVSVNIEVDKKAEITLIIDEGNNDFIKLKGQALLNGGIDKSGKVTLTGSYELEEGTYEMSFNFIDRSFDIQKGSKITWNGEPTDAILDITAVYNVNTSAVELVQDQINAARSDLRYRQRLPFEVHLNMDGPLLKPILTFEIKLPKEKTARIDGEIADQIEMRLNQLQSEPSELNKQVFSLLILNRFTPQNPFESAGGGTSAVTMARQSVSKILTEQLNNLADNLISGVDVNFDIVSSEDYTSGSLQNQTDLNVGVSKRLFNERLHVTVGTNINLEGGQQNNQTTGLGANNAPNVNIEYLLSKDGRYMLRAYRRNQYEGIVEGFIVETGIGFVMSLDFDHFREIFERRKSNKNVARQRKESEEELLNEDKSINNIQQEN